MLEHPIQILHYLASRERLEATVDYHGDELDLMGLYVQTLFELGDIDPETRIELSGMSQAIDSYYLALERNITQAKPRPMVSELFGGVLKQLQERENPRCSEIGLLLHRFSPDDQFKCVTKLKELDRIVRSTWRDENHRNSLILVPAKSSNVACVFTRYTDQTRERRHIFYQASAASALEKEHVTQCLVIGRNIDHPGRAYDFIAIYGEEDPDTVGSNSAGTDEATAGGSILQ